MADVLPQNDRFLHYLANNAIRDTNFMPGLPPLCTADFIEGRQPKPIRVLCVGMPRTGTMSLGAALGILGYRTYNHIEACMVGYRDMKCWNEALDAKYFGGKGKRYGRNEFSKILKGFDAVADAPAAPYFSEDLIEAFPEAKVILSERPVDNWVNSIAKTVAITFTWPSWPFIAWADDATHQWYQEAIRVRRITPMSDAFSADQPLLRAHYTEYYENIRKICPKERLLEFKTGVTGWKELCEFLGEEEAVGIPYPYVNESKTFVPVYAHWWWGVFKVAAWKVLTRGAVGFEVGWVIFRRRRLLPTYWRHLREFLVY